MKKIILSTLLVLGLSGAAFAQDAVAPDFTTLDTDASGGISLTELQVAMPGVTAEAFAAADTDASGELSAEEFAAATAPAPVPTPAM
jgi:Ca2+-binding EF-hand superfamily protein